MRHNSLGIKACLNISISDAGELFFLKPELLSDGVAERRFPQLKFIRPSDLAPTRPTFDTSTPGTHSPPRHPRPMVQCPSRISPRQPTQPQPPPLPLPGCEPMRLSHSFCAQQLSLSSRPELCCFLRGAAEGSRQDLGLGEKVMISLRSLRFARGALRSG